MRRITKTAWFGPKRYIGWGWTITSWQGLAVTLLAAVLGVLAIVLLGANATGYAAAAVVFVLYLAVVWLTGDPPGGPRHGA